MNANTRVDLNFLAFFAISGWEFVNVNSLFISNIDIYVLLTYERNFYSFEYYDYLFFFLKLNLDFFRGCFGEKAPCPLNYGTGQGVGSQQLTIMPEKFKVLKPLHYQAF